MRHLLAVALVLLSACSNKAEKPAQVTESASPRYDAAFWERWPEDLAEVSRYQLSGARQGTAFVIFTKETMSNSIRVKVKPGTRAKDDEFPILRMSLTEEMGSGTRRMLTAFAALAAVNERPAGVVTKVAWSKQELSGSLYKLALFDREAVRVMSHSHSDGEGDQEMRDASPQAAVASEDALMIWARGFAWPVLSAGESREVDALASMEASRFDKGPLAWTKARLERGLSSKMKIGSGEFEVERRSARTSEGREWIYHVEKAAPHRIVMYRTPDGVEGRLEVPKVLPSIKYGSRPDRP